MNCELIIPLLSAFHDGELQAEQKALVERHVATCASCAKRLESYQRLSGLVRQSPAPQAPLSLLARVESALTQERTVINRPSRSYRGVMVGVLLATAATLLGFAFLQQFAAAPSRRHVETAAAYDRFLAAFDAGENDAPQILVSEYQGEPIDLERASQILQHQSVARPTLLAKHQVANRFLLQMPHCKCVQTVYSCEGKTSLVLFEHEKEHSEWFDKRRMSRTECGGKDCCLVELNDGLAATWQVPGGYVTAVGVRDKEQLELLMKEIGSS